MIITKPGLIRSMDWQNLDITQHFISTLPEEKTGFLSYQPTIRDSIRLYPVVLFSQS